MAATDPVLETVNAVYLSDSRRVLATLIRLLGDFEVAEEAQRRGLMKLQHDDRSGGYLIQTRRT